MFPKKKFKDSGVFCQEWCTSLENTLRADIYSSSEICFQRELYVVFISKIYLRMAYVWLRDGV